MAFYEETNPCDVPLVVVRNVVRRFFPAIKDEEIIFLYHGSYNVFEIREDYIFRFPEKSLFGRKGFDLIQRENEILDLLRPKISLEIPQFVYLSSDPKIPFVGYRKISGQSLSRIFHKATHEQKMLIAKQLGNFLSELHSPKIYRLNWPTEFSPAIYRNSWKKVFLETREKLFPLFSIAQKEWVTHLFTDFLEDTGNFCFTPRVVHGDLDVTNILVDSDSFRITGIIDFEETGVYDPAVDFLFFQEGQEFIEHLQACYKGPQDSRFGQRMEFLWKRIPLIYLLTGVDHMNPRMIDAGFEMLKERMINDQ